MRVTSPLAALVLFLGGCAVSPPYEVRGDGPYPAEQRVIVAVTEATLTPSVTDRVTFWRNVRRVWSSLEDQPGLIGVARRLELFGNRAWTVTVWESEEKLSDFVMSETHQAAMAAASATLSQGRFARAELAYSQMPLSWGQAEKLLDQQKRTYKY